MAAINMEKMREMFGVHSLFLNGVNRERMKFRVDQRIIYILFSFETETKRNTFVGYFPKYCRPRASKMYCHDEKKHYYIVSFSMDDLRDDGVTKGFNEAAAKRRKKIYDLLNNCWGFNIPE